MALFPDLTNKTKGQKIAIIAGIVVAALAVVALITWACTPFINMLTDPEGQKRFEDWVTSLGPFGVLVLLGIQVLQIVIAFIPGEIVQVIAGAMYGTWGGLLLCLVGCVLASSIVFVVIRKFGEGLLPKLFNKEQLESFSFLKSSEKLETLVFILSLIPGLPKDLLTYVVPMTPIRLSSFIILSTIGRIPGMVASTVLGSSIVDANWPLIIGVFVAVIAIGGICIFKKDALMGKAKKLGGVKETEEPAD